jgi:hypothetical protein
MGVDIVSPIGDGPRGDDVAAMAQVTRAEYAAAAQEAGINDCDASWARFQAYRDGDHGPYDCWCSPACLAKHPQAPPRAPAAPAAEHYRSEGGPRQPRHLEAERARDDEHELERQRLLRIANEAGPRWF